MQTLFTNQVNLTTPMTTVQTFLATPQNLIKWIPAIQVATINQPNQLQITRTNAAVNSSELMTIEQTPDGVIYHSTGGKLSYQLNFTLTKVDHATHLSETLILIENQTHLPIQLLSPIAQHAFNQNLQALKHILQ